MNIFKQINVEAAIDLTNQKLIICLKNSARIFLDASKQSGIALKAKCLLTFEIEPTCKNLYKILIPQNIKLGGFICI